MRPAGDSGGAARVDYAAPRLVAREVDREVEAAALAAGLSPLQARLLGGRLCSPLHALDALISPSLRHLVHPGRLRDGARAAERIARAVAEGEHIGILTDYDVDGITSHVVILRTLVELFGVPRSRIHSLIGHRINDGYGISQPLVERALALRPRPTLVISADCGSSDEPRIARLSAAGIDVVVTDHHALPIDGPPPSAYAVVNPSRSDCDYPDATIAGCMVSWLTMSLARSTLIEMGVLPASTPKLSAWLSYVALGTVADCVSLGDSAINRAVVILGLSLINRMDEPCWRAMAERLGPDSLPFTAETLGFQMGPRINARSRLDDPYAALQFMLAETDERARHQLELLDQDNQSRKVIEANMTEEAKRLAQAPLGRGARVLVIHLADGHAGVQGIVASRLVQAFGRPCFVLTPAAAPGQLSGSGRSIEGVHLRAALQRADELTPGVLERFGGHAGAAGIGLSASGFEAFRAAIEQAVDEQLGERELHPLILTDGELPVQALDLGLLDEIERLAPFGREFESPLFEGRFEVLGTRLVGADGCHLMLELGAGSRALKAIWFRAVTPGEAVPFGAGARVRCAFRPSRNRYRGRESLQLMIEHAELQY
ncbi:single-stranded-DNA-specific exonuclease RecJ [Halotalea alkalilenta]|uniref:single-stranded-DNA-specific exonuclease RecJ n=1 Tax=Halotalea alkalilenta TaxID=376489 RepID=UPI00048509F9|nr:DHH family phosphoesterase [Halotalea alkalilenta]